MKNLNTLLQLPSPGQGLQRYPKSLIIHLTMTSHFVEGFLEEINVLGPSDHVKHLVEGDRGGKREKMGWEKEERCLAREVLFFFFF